MGKGLIQEGHVDEVERHRVGLGVLLVGVLRGLELPTCAPPRQCRGKTQHRAHMRASQGRAPCALPSAVLPSRVSGDTRKGWH